jgi:GNAT superfamily N-acetyltransferase
LLDPCGQAVATATAWFDDAFEGARWGRVHWVAILPEHQGHGLGRPLMAAVCQRLVALGHVGAFLRTSANRIPAIKLYRGFGFEPHPRSAAEEHIWRGILAQLGSAA